MVDQATHWRTMGGTLLARGLLVAAREAFQHWLDAEERTGDRQRMISPLNALATVDMRRKEYEDASAWLLRAEVLAAETQVDCDQWLRICHNVLVCAAEQYDTDGKQSYVERIYALVPHIKDQQLVARTWSTLAFFYGRARQLDQAVLAGQAALAQNRRLGTDLVGLCLLNLGFAYYLSGDMVSAEQFLRESIQESGVQGKKVLAAYAHTELGWIAFKRGDNAGAIEEGQSGLRRLLRQVNASDKIEVARISWLFGSVFAAWGERNAALKYLNRSAAYFAQRGSLPEWQEVSQRIGLLLTDLPHSSPGNLARPYLKQLDQLTGVLDLSDDLESVAPHLRKHAERVAALSLVLGQAIGLNDEELGHLHQAALLHDIGLVAIDYDVLARPEQELEPAAREMRALHPTLGAQMLAPFGFPTTVTSAVWTHHENFDGSGYPRGLSGQEIPIFGRIISLLEAYDAATTRNVPPWTHAEALSVVLRGAGSRFDPALSSRFAELFQDT